MKKEGISLITLIITIIVVIILAVAIIIRVAKSNPVINANEAVFKQDVAVMQDILNLEVGEITLENMYPPVLYTDETYTTKVTDRIRINKTNQRIGKVYYAVGNKKYCIIFGRKETAKINEGILVASTNIETINDITYRYTNEELPTYQYKELKWYVTVNNKLVLEAGNVVVGGDGQDWYTIKTQYYEFDAGGVGEWLSCEADESLEEGTRIEYSFSKSNDDKTYTEETENITKNGNSRYIKVKVEYQRKRGVEKGEATLNDLLVSYKLNGVENYKSINGGGLIQVVEKANLKNDKTYKINIKDESYTIHSYVYEGNQVWESKTFGNSDDVGAEGKYAQNMVVVKVKGNLTIKKDAIITAYNTAYGGPKGMLLCVTGNLINQGTISMTARGAYAKGQNVYLWKNINGSYETVPAVGASGGASVFSYNNQKKVHGLAGEDGENRQTGGGGSGGSHGNPNRVYSGAGETGTSYSGGSGGGAVCRGASNGTAESAQPNGGKGGNASAYETGVWTKTAGGGAGNPGGSGSKSGGQNVFGYKGENGTGGLLILYGNSFKNMGIISSCGSNGGAAVSHLQNYYAYGSAGGSSGGGSINIFTNAMISKGEINASGGEAIVSNQNGGAGGAGSISIGNVSSGSYIADK